MLRYPMPLFLDRRGAGAYGNDAALVPELVEWRWYYYFLHNQHATALKVLLHTKGTGRIIVISVPSYMA
jgi:hypothetical protein